MKHGINECEKRKEMFDLISNQYASKNIVKTTNDIKYIVTYSDIKFDVSFGFSQEGEWVFKEKDNICVLIKPKMFLYCIKLIEVPYKKIQMYIDEKFKEIYCIGNIHMVDFFPFPEMVSFVFYNMFDDYWLDLAWLWYEQLDVHEQRKLVDALKNLTTNKKISQTNRQKIKREIGRIMNWSESKK